MKFVYLLYITSILSCNYNKTSLVENLEVPEDINFYHQKNNPKSNYQNLVSRITMMQTLEQGLIGYNGKKSNQENFQKQLDDIPEIDSIIILTNHSNPIVRVLSFRSLVNRKYKKINKIFLTHILDNQTFSNYGGCIYSETPVNIEFYNAGINIFTQSEKLNAKKLLLKQYMNTAFEFYFTLI